MAVTRVHDHHEEATGETFSSGDHAADCATW